MISLKVNIKYAPVLLVHIAERPLDRTDQVPDPVCLAVYIDWSQINNIIQSRQSAVFLEPSRTACNNFLPMLIIKALPS